MRNRRSRFLAIFLQCRNAPFRGRFFYLLFLISRLSVSSISLMPAIVEFSAVRCLSSFAESGCINAIHLLAVAISISACVSSAMAFWPFALIWSFASVFLQNSISLGFMSMISFYVPRGTFIILRMCICICICICTY